MTCELVYVSTTWFGKNLLFKKSNIPETVFIAFCVNSFGIILSKRVLIAVRSS